MPVKREATNEVFQAKELRVDFESRTIMRDGAAIELTAKDFDLAVVFLRNVGRLLWRAHIHGLCGEELERSALVHLIRM